MSDMALVIKVCNYAAQQHTRQRRKNDAGIPYVNHVLEVADTLVRSGVNDVTTLCAAGKNSLPGFAFLH